MKTIVKPHSRNTSTQDISTRVTLNPLDKLLNLKYTPYTKMIRHEEKTPWEYYLVVCFLSGKGSEIFNTSNEVKNGKLYINIEVYTGNANEADYTLSQVIFNTDDIIIREQPEIRNLSNIIEDGIDIDYVVTVFYGKKSNNENSLIFDGENLAGGTTNPQDPYPPAKK